MISTGPSGPTGTLFEGAFPILGASRHLMIVAIDIFGVYDQDPDAWDEVIAVLQQAGHQIIGVSGGNPKMPKHEGYKRLENLGIPVYWTNRRAKRAYLAKMYGIAVDVVIDDKPDKWIRGSRTR